MASMLKSFVKYKSEQKQEKEQYQDQDQDQDQHQDQDQDQQEYKRNEVEEKQGRDHRLVTWRKKMLRRMG